MRFVCQRAGFHAEMRARATGTAERRNRLKPQDLIEIRIGLPSLDGQRRVAAVFQTALELEAQSARAEATALALREALLSGGRRISESLRGLGPKEARPR
jgi:type I restriction enzyme S subunit